MPPFHPASKDKGRRLPPSSHHSPYRGGKPGGRKFTKRPRILLDRVDYKDPGLLSNYITDEGKILPGRMSRLHPKDQRRLTQAIKRARYMALLPMPNRR